MPRIFISYRRADSRDQTERIHDRLVKAFGQKNVFLDVDEGYIPSGSDFATVLRDAVRKCDVLLVIIGPDWLNIRDPKSPNLRRLDNPEDFVRIEVETGLQNASTLVIPVLVKDAVPLYAEELPDSLRDLTKIQVETIRRNPDFHKDVSGLIKLIRNRFPRRGRLYLGVSMVIFTLIIVAALVLANGGGEIVLPTQTPEPATAAVLLLTERLDKTLTAVAPTMTDTPDLTRTIDALVTQYFITETAHAAETVAGYTDTPTLTVTPSITSSPTEDRSATETMDAATLVAVQQLVATQVEIDVANTRAAQHAIDAQATLNAQATANVPTNTLEPTWTFTPTRTAIPTPTYTPKPTETLPMAPTPTVNLTGTANINATQAILAAQNELNTQAAQATLDAFTDTPSPSSIATPEPLGIVAEGQGINLRSGPSTNDALVTQIQPGAIVRILQTNQDSTWLNIQLADHSEGWVRADLITRMPVAHNEDWTRIKTFFDSVEMVLAPTGCFMMGDDNLSKSERPVHLQCFNQPFWIDRYEVTSFQFKSFKGVSQKSNLYVGDQLPRANISWSEARDFCEKRGARLPTEREWEYAARGPDNLVYPWGNSFVSENIGMGDVTIGNGYYVPGPAVVGGRPNSASWVGALDMIGNVSEWTSSIFKPYPYDGTDGRENSEDNKSTRVRRGGWSGDSANDLYAYARSGVRTGSISNVMGFRCVRDY